MAPSCLNAGDLFRSHRDSGGGAIVDTSGDAGPRRLTYRELDDACDAVARGLQHAGVAPGEKIAILSLNRLEFAEVFFGAMRAGCTPVPVNVRLPDAPIEAILADAGVRLAFADREARQRFAARLRVIGFDDPGADGFAAFKRPGAFQSVAPPPGLVALLPYTSGSTGAPKGVMLTHAGVIWVSRAVVAARGLGPAERSLIAAPLYHKNGLNTLKHTLTAGGEVVLMERFEVGAYLRHLIDHRCTMLGGVPTMFVRLLKEIENYPGADLSCVTRIGFGSAPAAETLVADLRRVFTGAVIENNYGITEGGPVMFGPHPDGLPRPDNSVGYPLPDVEVRLDGDVPDQGVLSVRNPGVMLGYHGRPEATAEKLAAGWFRTGDIFRRDGDGFFFFVGRDDDMFTCGGENVHPGAVTALLERHPGVLQAAVVPLADGDKGAVPYAFVVRRPGAEVTQDEIKEFTMLNGPAYAHPRRILFVDAMPLTGNAKIDMNALKAHLAETVEATP